jgi:Tol biopolymer transport system component
VTLRSILAGAVLASVLLASGCGGSSGPPGDAIAFVSTRDGDYAIFEMNADGSNQGRVTDERGDPETPQGLRFQTDPAWSPDGARIAFASARAGSFDIYVMNADGTGTRRLTSTSANDQGPTWSADGSRIAFSRSDDGGHVWVMNADGSGARRLTAELAEEGEPSWSPDGSWIAYTRRASGSDFREIWVVRPDGSGGRGVTQLEAQAFSPTWSPDSQRIAFSATGDPAVADRYDIYVIGADGKNMARPTHSTVDAFEPAWSPAGDGIAFSRDGAIVVTTLAGVERRLTDPEDNDSSPAWNPSPTSEEEGS